MALTVLQWTLARESGFIYPAQNVFKDTSYYYIRVCACNGSRPMDVQNLKPYKIICAVSFKIN